MLQEVKREKAEKPEKPEAGAASSGKEGPLARGITMRFGETTRAALATYARERALSLSQATEQLVVAALAAHASEALDAGAAPALGAQVQSSVRAALGASMAGLTARLDRLSVEAGAVRLMSYALIAYAYGEGEARRAEEACLRVALKAAGRGEMAALPSGMVRHGS